ncbi:MAG: hypothetical protein WAM14_08015 [Candidatus Nitrosopolaris sp.]
MKIISSEGQRDGTPRDGRVTIDYYIPNSPESEVCDDRNAKTSLQ